MKEQEKVTPEDLKKTLTIKGVTSELKREKVIQKLQVNGCLIAMITDVLDSLLADEMSLMSLLDVQYKHEQKMHKNEMFAAARKYHYHMEFFTKSFFGNASIQVNLEDNAQDIYDIIKLLADHTNNHKEMETIKRSLRRRKSNHHIFD